MTNHSAHRVKSVLFGLAAACALMLAPSAFARSHWSVSIGGAGWGVGYSDCRHCGGHWGGYVGGYYPAYSYYAEPAYYPSYYGPGTYYAPVRYEGYYDYYPSYTTVYYDGGHRGYYRDRGYYRHDGYRRGYEHHDRGGYGHRAHYYDRHH